MFGVNSAGIKCKLESLDVILNQLNPQIWTIQETKLKPNEKLKSEVTNKYQIYYLYRKESQGGGLAIGIDKEIESTLIKEGNDEVEAMVVQIMLDRFPIKVVAAYGPQENALKEKKEKFWSFLEEEAITAELQDHGFLLQMDGNLHGGPNLVNDDPNVQNTNGKFFEHFLERNPFLTVANNLNICQGKITRIRKLQNKTEIAILDFLIMNDKLRPFLSKFIIDEERNFCLSNFSQYKKNKRVIETDHNLMLADFKISVPKRKPDRIELFNLRDKKCQEIFSQETESNPELFQCFDSHLPFEVQCKICKM